MRFDGEANYTLTQQTLAVSVGRRLEEGFSFNLSGGAVVDGQLDGEGTSHDVNPGWFVSGQLARRWIGGNTRAPAPFLTTTLGLGFSMTKTEQQPESFSTAAQPAADSVTLTASDLRLGVLLGISVWDGFAPYLATRAFLGPVNWTRRGESSVGSDRHHYTLGGGLAWNVTQGSENSNSADGTSKGTGGISLLVDGSFLGERSISGGLTVSF
ncbi:MAG: hypothetical protein R3B89_14485 [Polyangiaceae bacterium]